MRSARALTASLLDTSSPLKQDLANYATEPMGKRPRPRTDRLGRAADGRRQPENDCFFPPTRVRDDSLRRIPPQTRYFRQSNHGVLVRLHGLHTASQNGFPLAHLCDRLITTGLFMNT